MSSFYVLMLIIKGRVIHLTEIQLGKYLNNFNKTVGDSNFGHYLGGLIKYKRSLLTVGGTRNQITEILERNSNGTYKWSIIEPGFAFTRRRSIQSHSLMNIKSSDMNEEYVLLSGGMDSDPAYYDRPVIIMENVYKFNGTWHYFGTLKRPRAFHNSILWNGAVYFMTI